jgi:hypothetical protein
MLFISIFSNLEIFHDYNTPSKLPFDFWYLFSAHKQKEDTYMMYIFDRSSFLNTEKLAEFVDKFFSDAETEGKKIKITIFTNGEITRDSVPENVILLNIREVLKLDDKAIILDKGGNEMKRY